MLNRIQFIQATGTLLRLAFISLMMASHTSILFAFSFYLQNPISKIKYYIDHRMQRETQIQEILKSEPDKWFSDMDLVGIIYADTPQQLWKAAARNVSQHLKKLQKDQVIQSKEQEPTDGEQLTKWKYMLR